MCQEFSNSSVSRFLLRFNHEKTFRDRGSGFEIIMAKKKDKQLTWKDLKEHKNHDKIWKKIKPIVESIEAVMEVVRLNHDENERYRLISTERHFIRGLIFAESEKYVSESKPTKEGFVIDYEAVEYCFEKIFINNLKKNKKADPEIIIPAGFIITEEVKSWANLPLHPKINDVAKKAYKKGNAEIMKQLSILVLDKSIDFSAPAIQFLKKYFVAIIIAIIIVAQLITTWFPLITKWFPE